MNSLLDRRAIIISKSFKDLDRYSPSSAIIEHLKEQGKITSSTPFAKAQKLLVECLQTDAIKFNVHIPVFSKKKGCISVQQEKLFDTFVLANVFASLLRGIDQYPAGICMLEHGFEQFSIFAHYTSIYQLVNAVLSLHGICFIANPISGQTTKIVKEEKTGEKTRQLLKTTPTNLGDKCLEGEYKSDKWSFVPCGFGHEE
jgi:hypothetical protein